MNVILSNRSLRLGVLSCASALCASSFAVAAESTAVQEASRRYEQDRAACASGRSNQDRATCLREAVAALAEVKRGRTINDNVSYLHNARARCEVLQDADRTDCEARMNGQGTTTGTAAGGGIYRELVTREVKPVDPAASAPLAR